MINHRLVELVAFEVVQLMARPQRVRIMRNISRSMLWLVAFLACLLSALIWPGTPLVAAAANSPQILSLEVDGMITAGTAAFIRENILYANQPGSGIQAVLIRLNTPGGLLDATLDIMSDISQSGIPVITYVSPAGAIAASAGSMILIASHIAAMAPGTTTGAAMPVAIDPASGGSAAPADEKTINFLAGHLRSIARERGRPDDTIARFVRENLTLDANEALAEGVIDVVAATTGELLQHIDGRPVRVGNDEVTLSTSGAVLVEAAMTWSQRLQDLVSNPQLAFLLLIGGAYALYFGLSAPGTLVPETLGAVMVLLGLYGLGLFDTNLTGILLVLLGIGFLIAELFTPTHGALTAAGIVSLALGALLFPAEPLLGQHWFRSFRATVWGLVVGGGVLSLIATGAIVRSRRNVERATPLSGIPREGVVVSDLNPEGQIRLRGEIWRARSQDGSTITAGSIVRVTGREGLTLYVKRAPEQASQDDAVD